MNIFRSFLILSTFCFCNFLSPLAQASTKEEYNYFNPAPEDKMRELITDRPDKTEAAYTLDAGHFAHETDIVNYTYDRHHGEQVDSVLVMAPNLKVGLTNRIDLQLIIESFSYVTESSNGVHKKQSGFGDMTTRLKVNLWGNDGGKTAFAIMPFLKLPTAQGELGNGSVEGGQVLPFAINFCEGLDLSLMSQENVVRDEASPGYHYEFVHSGSLSKSFTDKLAGYSELWSSVSTGGGPLLTADFGLTYLADRDTQFDIGLNVGINEQADDLNPFIGVSQRF